MNKRKNQEEKDKTQRKFLVNTFNKEPFTQTQQFCSNRIKTAKYNIFTFLPLALFRTFVNGFNLFFLFNAILMSIPNISSLSPMSAITPFIVVICISLIREAFEDLRKHKYDKDANNSLTITYKKTSFVQTKWAEMHVGEIIKVEKNQILPVDILVIKSSMANGFCYLETSNLDGETALKPREAILISQKDINTENDLGVLLNDSWIEVDHPNKDIYNIEGTAFLNGEHEQKSYFDIKNILLRGGKLKNVEYVYGIILYTGKETKLMQNINHTSYKTSKIAHVLNMIVLFIVIVVLLLCVLCTIAGGLFRNKYLPRLNEGKLGADYLFHEDPNSKSDDVLEIVRNFTGNFSIFSTLIPLSIIIVFAVVNTYQAIMLEFFDYDLKKDEGDKVKSFSMSLQEEMGMVKYIFTDKTGTLTCNEMEFKACSIFNCLFDDENDADYNEFGLTVTIPQTSISGTRTSNYNSTSTSKMSKTFKKQMLIDSLYQNIPIMVNNLANCPFSAQKYAIQEFLFNLSLNHNVLTEYNNETKEFTYQGANPDEVTLVTAASEFGFRFLERNQNSISVNIAVLDVDIIKNYELLNMFEFTSSRQRSSMIVKDKEDNTIKLYLKGSDRKVFESIDAFSRENILDKTKDHIDSFARRGLRTLCYGYKVISQEKYEKWKSEYDDLKYQCINDKSRYPELENKISEIENDIVLLGVTALEDKLQENVKEDLQMFIEAGINVWMITGDKMDTAESIGHSCRLFNDDTEVFKIKELSNQDDVLGRMKDIKEEMTQLEADLKEIAMAENLESIMKSNTNPQAPSDKQLNKVDSMKENQSDEIIILYKNRSESNSCLGKNRQTNQIEIDDKDICLQNENDSVIDAKESKYKYNNNEENNSLNDHLNPKNPDPLNDASILRYMVEKNYLGNSSTQQQFENISMLKGNVISPSYIQGDVSNNTNSNKLNRKKEIIDKANNNLAKKPHFEIENDNFQCEVKEKQKASLPTNQKKFQEYFSKCKEELIKYHNMQNKRNLKDRMKFWKKKTLSSSNVFELKMNFGLIIEGQAISQCIKEGEAGNLFWELIQSSRSLICCRCSPVQKAEVVQFIKTRSKQITLAIGDGGNDVNMIKTANVGIGLFGKEGYQAAYNSDYAISQFKYLKRLLFINGRFSLERNSYFLYFYLFKNMLFSIPQFCLCCLSGFSGVNLYDEWYYTGYNTYVTILPVAARAVSEEDFDPEFKNYPIKKELLSYLLPDIYKEYRDGIPFSVIRFFYIFLSACCLAAPAYLIPAYTFSDGIKDRFGVTFSYWDVSASTYLTIVFIHFFIIFADTQYYNWLVFTLYSLQILVNLLFFIILESLNYGIGISGDLYYILGSLKFWFTLILSCAICTIPYFIYRRFDILFGNMLVNRIKVDKCQDFYVEKYYKKKIALMTRATRSVAKFRKIYQMNEEGVFDNFADQQMKKIVDEFREKKRKKRVHNNKNVVIINNNITVNEKS